LDTETGMACYVPWEDLPRAHGYPSATARWRVVPEDFVVEEVLGFEPAGKGQHVLVQVRKRGTNTPWVAREVARLAGVASSVEEVLGCSPHGSPPGPGIGRFRATR